MRERKVRIVNNYIEFFEPGKCEKDQRRTCTTLACGKKITLADLADGKLLEDAVERYADSRSEEHLNDLFAILRISTVWVPCRRDQDDPKRRMQPELVRNGKEWFFQVFTGPEEILDLPDGCEPVEMAILDAVELSKNCDANHYGDKHLRGIVINKDSMPFVVNRELYGLIMCSNSALLYC